MLCLPKRNYVGLMRSLLFIPKRELHTALYAGAPALFHLSELPCIYPYGVNRWGKTGVDRKGQIYRDLLRSTAILRGIARW